MGSTFASVYMSYRAMAAATAATSTVGNNISNMNTEGYTRQKTVLESQTLSGYKARFDQRLISTGNGVAATTTVQIRDTFLDARYRSEAADTGRYDSISTGLKDIENVLDEISTKGMQNQFDDFVNQLQNLSQYPTSKDIGLVVRTSAQQLVQMLNVYSNQLSQVRDQQAYDLASVTVGTDFNSTVQSIAELNGQIREEFLYGNNPNELMDRRNTLIDELSKMANIKVTTTADEVADGLILEHVSISLVDENTATSIGLVDHTKANTLQVFDDGDKVRIAMDTTFRLPGTPKSVDYDDLTDYFNTGSISGYLDMLNGHGDYANTEEGENDFRGIPYYLDTLNTFAKNFADGYNKLNSIQTRDTNSDAMKIYTSNVAKTFEYDQASMEKYLEASASFKFEDATDPSNIVSKTVSETISDTGVVVNQITVPASSVSAVEFMEGYIESFEPPLTLGIDYSYDTDGNLTLKNPAAVAGLTPNTQLAGNELRAAKNALFTNGEGEPAEITTKTKNLFAPSDGSKEITAANLAVSAEWMSNALYITTTKDYDTATGESVLPGGNDNVVRMISAVAQERTFNADPADETSPLKFTGTYNEFLISMGGTLALDVELNANYLETSETVLTSIDNTREATSGVNLDEEASHLLTFQSAYNAAARYFTALDEMLDKLINSTGLVGR